MRLKEDMQIEIAYMDDAMGYAEARIAAALLIEDIASNPSAAVDNRGAGISRTVNRQTHASTCPLQ